MKPIIFALLLLLALSVYSQEKKVTFEKVSIAGVGSILIPSNMELQSGMYKKFSDSVMKEMGFDTSGLIVYQQAGKNDISVKSNTYARVMIEEIIGKPGDYRSLKSRIVLTKKQLMEINKTGKDEFLKQFDESKVGLKLVRWDGISIDKISNADVLKTAYLRQLDNNPEVYVELFYIENYDRKYIFTISYRIKDAHIWEDVLSTVKNSFIITEKKATFVRKKKGKG